VTFKSIINDNETKEGIKNSQTIQKMVFFYNGLHICGIKVEFSDDSFSKLLGIENYNLQIIEMQ